MNPFRTFWDLGYHRVVPIVPYNAKLSPTSKLAKNPNARGKAVGVKGRNELWHSYNWVAYENDELDLVRWDRMGAGAGIKTAEDFIGIDADTTNLELARTIAQKLTDAFGPLPARIGRYPKVLYPLRLSGPMRYTKLEFGEPNERGLLERIEVLCAGQQFVAHGIHPGTLKPYSWPLPLVPYDKLTVASPNDVIAVLKQLNGILPAARPLVIKSPNASQAVSQEALKGELNLVRKAVGLIPNAGDEFLSREIYRDIGYAIKAALIDHPNEAFEIWSEWAHRWAEGENSDGMLEKDWAGFKPPYRAGASLLYEMAEKYAPGQFLQAEAWFHKLPMLTVEGNLSSESAGASPLELITFDESRARKMALNSSTRPLIKGFLDQGALSILYGESNVGKTFVAMDIAFHIAAGLEWAGMRTQGMAVLYIAAEGGVGAHKRIEALGLKFGPTCGGARFYFRLSNVNLLHADADLPSLIATIKSVGPVGLVVVDTLSRAMSGGDENASTDMGTMVRNIDVIRKITGSHVMAVHHSGKDRARGARGHSLLRAATDTEIEIAENQILVTKQRDLDKEFASAFVLDVVELGKDEDGDPVTSCTVRLVTRGEVPMGVATPSEQAVLNALATVMEGSTARGATHQAILAVLRLSGQPGADQEMVRSSLRRMDEKKLVRKAGRGLWVQNTIKSAADHFNKKGVFE